MGRAAPGCAVAAAGDCAITFSGAWGTVPTTTSTSLVVQGDGLTTGYDTSPAAPNALDFGDVRWDLTKTMPVSVINTTGTTLKIMGTSITPGTAQTGELTVSAARATEPRSRARPPPRRTRRPA